MGTSEHLMIPWYAEGISSLANSSIFIFPSHYATFNSPSDRITFSFWFAKMCAVACSGASLVITQGYNLALTIFFPLTWNEVEWICYLKSEDHSISNKTLLCFASTQTFRVHCCEQKTVKLIGPTSLMMAWSASNNNRVPSRHSKVLIIFESLFWLAQPKVLIWNITPLHGDHKLKGIQWILHFFLSLSRYVFR